MKKDVYCRNATYSYSYCNFNTASTMEAKLVYWRNYLTTRPVLTDIVYNSH